MFIYCIILLHCILYNYITMQGAKKHKIKTEVCNEDNR
jgi:hypothetical protein